MTKTMVYLSETSFASLGFLNKDFLHVFLEKPMLCRPLHVLFSRAWYGSFVIFGFLTTCRHYMPHYYSLHQTASAWQKRQIMAHYVKLSFSEATNYALNHIIKVTPLRETASEAVKQFSTNSLVPRLIKFVQ